MRPTLQTDLLLVGGGHSHLFVLEALVARPDVAARTMLVTERSESVYSGMIPGVIEGRYDVGDARLPVESFARTAGIRVVTARGISLNAASRTLEVADGRVVHFGVVSLDVGSTVSGREIPGVPEFTLPTRPLEGFVERVEREAVHGGLGGGSGSGGVQDSILVIGGGAAGVELAFALRHGIGPAGDRFPGVGSAVRLVHDGDSVPSGASRRLRRLVRRAARRAGIELVLGRRVVEVTETGVVLAGGVRIDGRAVVWAAGAVGTELLRSSDLLLDTRGFVRVRDTLQSERHDHVLASGDCAVPSSRPDLPRAGVHAVRQGPIVAQNLLALLDGRPLKRYQPQTDFLRLLNLADGTAIGGKWGIAMRGRWIMRLKDRIDRRFVRRFTPPRAAPEE